MLADYSENYDLQNVITPVNISKLRNLLSESGYNGEESKFLCDGFELGFDLGYQGPQNIQFKSANLKLKQPDHKIILWNKVIKEVQLK